MKVLIYDVHASESGALSILNDLYATVSHLPDKSVQYMFAVSTPIYKPTDNIQVIRYPWVKKSWFHRIYFDQVTTRKILKEFKPDKVYSLQNKGIHFYHGIQEVYLHLPFILCDYRFSWKKDGKRLWLYQNVLSKSIFKSLRSISKVIVQTQWMKDALVEKAHVRKDNIEIQAPNIVMNDIGTFRDIPENRKRFIYPATAFHYKNHMTILRALKYAKNCGLKDYEVLFTIREDENSYTKQLSEFCKQNKLNVKFIGQMPRKKIFELYTKSVLLFPSFVESFGLPLLEGKLSGTYVLASNCPFSREILNGYGKARFFEAMDYETLGKEICMIVQGE